MRAPKSQQTTILAGGDLRKSAVIRVGGYTLRLLASNGVSMINRYSDRVAPGPARPPRPEWGALPFRRWFEPLDLTGRGDFMPSSRVRCPFPNA
jgi:hypothetical protein